MDNLNLVLANNLKKIRDSRKLSLDRVADLTGVSKSMLGQIERGESNPTISIVWKIANGLKISFTDLINVHQPEIVVLKKAEVEPLVDDGGKYKIYPFFPFEEGRRFEMYSVDIEIDGKLNAEAHGEGTEEFLSIFQGELTVRVDEKEYTIKKGDSIRFKADKPHGYRNSGNELAMLSMIVFYPI
ncbi:MAG: helix-turn-helix transcriptional regulator [Candidatus Riflebacteria bacterium]|nr:helix-turn-helix transcriptional regulator [Candidatus Riflebacteria bacterium]